MSVKLRSNSVSLKSSPATSEAGREIKASSRVEEAKEDEWTSSRGSSRTANVIFYHISLQFDVSEPLFSIYVNF